MAVWHPDLHGRRRLVLDGMFLTAACLARKVNTCPRIVAVTDVVSRRPVYTIRQRFESAMKASY